MKTLIETRPTETFAKPKSLLICLLLSLLFIAAQAQTPVELTSITSTTNGVSVAWTDPGPGQAYTVQVRESLTSGAWRNGATRYRWPWPWTYWGDEPRSLPAARYYRVLAQAAATPNRGKLLTSYLKGQSTVSQQNAAFAAWGIAYFATAKFGIVSRVFTYETVDPYGLPITNSALLILPMGPFVPMGRIRSAELVMDRPYGSTVS